jgi:signal transduction histidine kinase
MELRYMMDACEMQAWRISLEKNTIEFYQGLSNIVKTFTLQQLSQIFVDQDNDLVKSLSNPSTVLAEPLFYVGLMHPLVSDKKKEKQWIQINSIPEYDENGQLKGAFGVWRNINQLMQKQEQLKQETERANASGQLKSVFLANMTHEIRTPLNAIVGFADVLPLMSSQEEKQEMIRVIMNNCDMLLRLINDILAVSSLESDGIKVEPKEVDFSQMFDELCETLKLRIQDCVPSPGQEAGKPCVEFIKDNPYPSLTVNVDGGRLQQVLTNFMTNSVKYTHQGHIKLGYRKEQRKGKDGLYLYCEDTGEGIAKENQGKIFDRFYKVNDFIQGTGLGLAICKAIADACNGAIGVESEGQGTGTTFWIWVPINE